MKAIFRHNEEDEWTQLEIDGKIVLENHRLYAEDILEWLADNKVIKLLVYTDEILE